MHLELFEILRCPYCGGPLELVESLFHRRSGDEISDGILGCHCCIFPVVDGIPVLHLQPNATAARDQMQAEHPEQALRTMVGLESEAEASAFEAVAASEASTYRETVEALFHRTSGDEIRDGILGCQCCIFPVVDGIPVLHLQTNATVARDLVQTGQPEAALRAMIGLETDAEATAFEAAAR